MSQRELMAMSADEVAAFLAARRRAQLGTINADGTPHLVPMSYVLIDGLLTFWTDPRSRKVVNLRRDPRITVLVEDGATFAEMQAVQLSGHGEITPDPDSSLRVGLALFERAAGRLDDDIRATVAALVPERVGMTVHAERVVSWDHRKLEGVRPSEIGT
jgi:PPOX class probable F420-dependent enzyme